MKLRKYFLIGSWLLFAGCASEKVILSNDDVKFSKADPPSNCQEAGNVSGRTTYASGTTEEAIADMKHDAARKGANFVKFGELSATGTVVTGIAFKCP